MTDILTTNERVTRMFEHKDADRVPITDYPWGATVERWEREGMPKGADFIDYFDLDGFGGVYLDITPRYPVTVLEETDRYVITKTDWGTTIRNWKHDASVPEFMDFTIKDLKSWKEAKTQIDINPDRINWEYFDSQYKRWMKEGFWKKAEFWFGFDVTHSWIVGTERVLMAMLEEPEWMVDMFNTQLDTLIGLHEILLDKGYTFDEIFWPDDMGYKGHTFFSLNTYREMVKPVQKRAIEWAHSKGMKAHLHSCGNVNDFIPDLIEIGLDALNPLEVKAGMNPKELKAKYGNDLVFHGGINAVNWGNTKEIAAEIEDVVPVMKQDGGYIFSSDHSIPSDVSLEDFKYIISKAKEYGSY